MVPGGRTKFVQSRAALVSSSAGGAHPVVEEHPERAPPDMRDCRACAHTPLRVLQREVPDGPILARPPVEEVAAERTATKERAREHRSTRENAATASQASASHMSMQYLRFDGERYSTTPSSLFQPSTTKYSSWRSVIFLGLDVVDLVLVCKTDDSRDWSNVGFGSMEPEHAPISSAMVCAGKYRCGIA
ncbi:hypothetical protein GSI_12267 [Ganoderma sinense ZZ0214-1]|uniref:Uncharacterized protein n=1 Tax=Ganoderma sinense ZZ0214-1 TaxID=1077348 RepID=A0A2G8RYB0_9APHY|nr:hypothetical protein GSI_12267 [Ganoderma sinense ZZ0214-1]